LDLISKDDEGQDKAILAIKQGLVDHSFVADPEINLQLFTVGLPDKLCIFYNRDISDK
jgi:hypothetical protein